MNKSDDISNIAKALVAFHLEAKDPIKDIQGFGYKHADLKGVLDIIRPLSAKNKLAHAQLVSTDLDKDCVIVETIIMHESNQFITFVIFMPILKSPLNKDNKPKMSRPQEIGATITYARRYALCAAFGLAQADDDAALPVEKPFNRNNDAMSKQISLNKLKKLIKDLNISNEDVQKWVQKAGFQSLDELSITHVEKLISFYQKGE